MGVAGFGAVTGGSEPLVPLSQIQGDIPNALHFHGCVLLQNQRERTIRIQFPVEVHPTVLWKPQQIHPQVFNPSLLLPPNQSVRADLQLANNANH
jgi:hypothetical protein